MGYTPGMTPNEIGQRIRAARKAARLTQAQLAKAAKVDTATVSHLETGHRQGSARVLQALAKALGSSVDALLGPEQVEHPPVTAAEAVPAVGEILQLLGMKFGTLPPEGQRRVLRVIRAILE